jgi:hypothetical protein
VVSAPQSVLIEQKADPQLACAAALMASKPAQASARSRRFEGWDGKVDRRGVVGLVGCTLFS